MRVVILATALALLTTLAATPAQASCTLVSAGTSDVLFCDDDNGNGVPDEVSATAPGAAQARYVESEYCWGATCFRSTQANAAISAPGADAYGFVACEEHVGDPDFNCYFALGSFGSPVASGFVFVLESGPSWYTCAGGNTIGGPVTPICMFVPQP